MVNTCALYGASNYANNWIGINLLIVLVSLAIIAAVYSLSRVMPERVRGRVTEATRSEITQSIISVLIIAILIGSAQAVCNTSVSLGKTILMNSGVPSSQASLSPFQYADYYIGNLAMHSGLALLTSVYSKTISYDIEATVYGGLSIALNNYVQSMVPLFEATGFVSVSPSISPDLSTVLRLMSDQYLLVFVPIITLVVGALFLQYLALPVLQYTAFVVILPVAIAMRSMAFAGINLRNTSNAVLAIAIAAYFIYPLAVLFDSYMMYWVFNPLLNPSYQYLHTAYTINALPVDTFLSQSMPSSAGSLGAPASFVFSALSNIGFLNTFNLFNVVPQTQQVVNDISELLFQGVVLFALNVAITTGFAMSLTKALNAGVEGAGSFWSNI